MNTTSVMMMMMMMMISIISLTCGNEDPPGERLHPVADGSHCYRVVPSRLKLIVIVIIMLVNHKEGDKGDGDSGDDNE